MESPVLGCRDGSLPRRHLEQWNVGHVHANDVLGIFLVIDRSGWAIPMRGYGPSPQGVRVVCRCDNMQAVQRQTAPKAAPITLPEPSVFFLHGPYQLAQISLCMYLGLVSLSR